MQKRETSISISKKIYIALFFLIFSLLLTILLYATERNVQYLRVQRELYGKFVVQSSAAIIDDRLSTAVSNFYKLNESIKRLSVENEDADVALQEIGEFLDYYSRFNSDFYNIALVSPNGQEIARIDNNDKLVYPNGTKINYLISTFFRNTVILKDNTILVSVSENESLSKFTGEEPAPNLVVLSSPIYIDGELKAVLALNYDIGTLFDYVNGFSHEFDADIDILNKSGYLLSTTSDYHSYGYSSTRDFSKAFPQEWSMLVRNSVNQVNQTISENGLFTYIKIDLTEMTSNAVPETTKIIFETPSLYLITTTLKNDGFENMFIDSRLENISYTIKNNFFYVGLIFLISTLAATLAYYRQVSLKKIQYNSDFDSLTDTYNRRAGMQLLRNMLNSDDDEHLPVSICFLDINGLKDVNDILGHQYGDELIVTISNTINKKLRSHDIFMRVGGDEFILILKNTSETEAEQIWEKIEESFRFINDIENRSYRISVSHGIIEYAYKDDSHLDEVLIKADAKMYENKKFMKRDFKSVK